MKLHTSIYCQVNLYLTTLAFCVLTVVTARADYQSTVLSDHPLAYYPLNLAVDTNIDANGFYIATDVTGNTNNGEYVNIYPGYNNVPGPSPYITNGVSFDGQTTYVDLGTGSNTALLNFGGQITLEAWVEPANTGNNLQDIIAKGYDASLNYDETVLREDSNVYTGNGGSGGKAQVGKWAYVVSTYDGTNWNTYVDGVRVATSGSSTGAAKFPDPWAIGNGTADGAGRLFEGNISQAAIYNYGLSAEQVLAHFYMGELNEYPSNAVPIILTQPQAQSTYLGGSAKFSATFVSALPTTEQWYKNGSAMNGETNSSLVLNNVQASDAADYSVIIGNRNGTTNSVKVTLSLLTPGNSLKWSSNANSGAWDTGNSANWINLANNQQTVFNTKDQVLFDDTPGVPTNVTVNGSVSPSIITVNSDTNDFVLNGSGTISGPGSFVKKGASALTITSAGNFTGPVTISGGSVYAGNYCFQSASSLLVTNNATLDFGGSTYASGQTLNISGTGVNGKGALYNSVFNPSQLYNIVLDGDATIGCHSNDIWGLQAGSTLSGNHKLTIKWGGSGDYTEWNGVKFAKNLGDIELARGKLGIKNMGSDFGNPDATFTVDAGAELDFWTSDFGYAKNYHIFGKYQILTSFKTLNANYTLENGCQFTGVFGNGNQTITGTFTLNGVAHLVLGDANFIFTNVISGSGGFIWDAYNHQLILQSSNTYTGPTIIGGGQQILTLVGEGSISHSSLIFLGGGVDNYTNTAIDVSGRSDQTLTLASGQTMEGIGGINGSLTVSSGAVLSPAGTNTTLGITTGANAVGRIAVLDNVTLNGTTLIKLNGSGTNDMVQAGTGIAYGGTLELENISNSPLAAGDSFDIFHAANYSGSFANIIPATPGAGLMWDTNQLSSGIVSVVTVASQPIIGSASLSGDNLILAGSGGAANGTFYLLTSTNLATPLKNWTPISTNMFDGNGNFNVTNAVDHSTYQQFYLLKQP